jgi:dihydrofolate synthase/folylpolyglutamate synthase
MPTSTKTMTSFADVQEALRPLYDNSRTNYDLDNMSKLMEFLGNPQNRLRVVHIAGTSGKTSTAYYAAGLLQAAGHSVGLTVSPHVDEINERVQIDGVPLDERTFCK